MYKRKTLQELTIKDNFMFGSVMADPDNCKGLLELVLGIRIERIEVDTEKLFVHNPAFKSVRLDVYAKDENHTHYNVEMQVKRKEIEKRSRYYHSQMDMETIRTGKAYETLPRSYVIFICDFDPFGYKKYMYSFSTKCDEVSDLKLNEERYSIFLNTKGNNESEVSKELVSFLKYVNSKVEECETDFEDAYVAQLQKTVKNIKQSRDMEEKYMTLEEMLREEREEAKEEGKQEGQKEAKEMMIRNMLSRDISVEMVAEIAQEPIEKIREMSFAGRG